MNSYQIVLNGVMLAMDEQEVQQSFARIFNLSPEKAAAILAKPKTVLRSNLDATVAEMYREKLLAIGVDVDVRDTAPSKRLTDEMESEQVAAPSVALMLEPLSLAVEAGGDCQPRYQGNRTLAIAFDGSGIGYWRIWFVNVLLSLLSLGFYSPWASLRSKIYFYSHAALDGAPFQYIGRPVNLLLQRLLLVVWLVFCVWSYHQTPPLVLASAGSLLLLPLFLWWLMKARYEAVVWRSAGVTLDADIVGLYRLLFLPVALLACVFGVGALPVLGVISLPDSQLVQAACFGIFFIGFPYWHAAVTRFFISHAHCGSVYLASAVSAWSYYKLYFFKTPFLLLVFFAPLAVAAYWLANSDSVQAIVGIRGLWHGELKAFNLVEIRNYCLANAIPLALLFAACIWLLAYVRAGVTNLRYDDLALDKTVLTCEIRARRLFWLYLSNAVAIVLSVGLFIPFAYIRVMKYRMSCVTVYASYDLDDIVTGARTR